MTVTERKMRSSLTATVAFATTLILTIHLFLFPILPSFKYFTVRQNDRLVDATFNAVIYHNAPWKARIGSWLSGCHSITEEIDVAEIIHGKSCKNSCSGHGICNYELGQCRCFHGFSGEGCSRRLQLNCNHEISPEDPYGQWVVSICSAYCDTTRAMCFCGEGTKYPDRPVAEACGFRVNVSTEPASPKLPDWTKADLDVFTTNRSKPGWCNVDPAKAYEGTVKFKEECDCKYDCLSGRFCEVPVQCVCINQCSGHGQCHGGSCKCHNGWYGTDCSTPSLLSSVREWPRWLRPAQLEIPDFQIIDKPVSLNVAVKKKRPLVYVYDLPSDFNSQLLEGRHFKYDCVNRIYDNENATFWTNQLYGSQLALYESILASPHRTLNGEDADFFFVPVLDSCIISRAFDAPHFGSQEHLHLRSSLTLDFYRRAYDYIAIKHPYWNHSLGRDHIWFFSWDEGACCAPKEIWNSMMLVHWGNTNSKHNHSTTAYFFDNWDEISFHKRGRHPCFDPDKDLVLPAWKLPDVSSLQNKLWDRPLEKRKMLFYFNGNLGPSYPNGRPEALYSIGIRQKVAEEFGSSPNIYGKLGKQHSIDVTVTPIPSQSYQEDLASSVFCGVFPGDGWSGRMEDSVLHGCIPVIIQDGIFLPYENVLYYESFAVRVSEEEIPNLVKILRGFNVTEVEHKLMNVHKIWQRFLYRDSILLEAERQRRAFGYVKDWAVKFLQLAEDDVFATFIQVLHYKLHNDPWRQQLGRRHSSKDFGLPPQCYPNS